MESKTAPWLILSFLACIAAEKTVAKAQGSSTQAAGTADTANTQGRSSVKKGQGEPVINEVINDLGGQETAPHSGKPAETTDRQEIGPAIRPVPIKP